MGYPTNIAPPDFLAYDGFAWSLVGTIGNPGPYTLVSRTATVPVQSCSDPIVTGSNASGYAVPYLDYETRGTVTVSFPGMANGIPFFGVSHEVIDNATLLTPGRAAFSLSKGRNEIILIPSAEGSGTLQLTFTGVIVNYAKVIVVLSGGQTTQIRLQASTKSSLVTLVAGDKVSVLVEKVYPGQNITGQVSWNVYTNNPRLYHTTELSFSGSAAISAIGFTGRSSRSAYQAYASLPAEASSAHVNPDSIVTVQGQSGTEMLLARCTSVGGLAPDISRTIGVYDGSHLVSPLTFKFYAGRSVQGGHGEMDVWLTQSGTFPPYFKVSSFKALELPAWWYRKDTADTDTSRNSLRVVSSPATYTLPRVYTTSAGKQLVLRSDSHANTILVGDVMYGQTGTANGLAYAIIDTIGAEDGNGTVVTSGTLIETQDGEVLITEDSQSLEIEL